jgi:hypothetical protein
MAPSSIGLAPPPVSATGSTVDVLLVRGKLGRDSLYPPRWSRSPSTVVGTAFHGRPECLDVETANLGLGGSERDVSERVAHCHNVPERTYMPVAAVWRRA